VCRGVVPSKEDQHHVTKLIFEVHPELRGGHVPALGAGGGRAGVDGVVKLCTREIPCACMRGRWSGQVMPERVKGRECMQ
jgi:hypothetical protein